MPKLLISGQISRFQNLNSRTYAMGENCLSSWPKVHITVGKYRVTTKMTAPNFTKIGSECTNQGLVKRAKLCLKFKSLLFWLAGVVSWLAVEVLSSCMLKIKVKISETKFISFYMTLVPTIQGDNQNSHCYCQISYFHKICSRPYTMGGSFHVFPFQVLEGPHPKKSRFLF